MNILLAQETQSFNMIEIIEILHEDQPKSELVRNTCVYNICVFQEGTK